MRRLGVPHSSTHTSVLRPSGEAPMPPALQHGGNLGSETFKGRNKINLLWLSFKSPSVLSQYWTGF